MLKYIGFAEFKAGVCVPLAACTAKPGSAISRVKGRKGMTIMYRLEYINRNKGSEQINMDRL